MKVTGHIVQPSDSRAKTNVEEVNVKKVFFNEYVWCDLTYTGWCKNHRRNKNSINWKI